MSKKNASAKTAAATADRAPIVRSFEELQQQTENNANVAIRDLIARRRQNEDDRVAYYLDQFLKNEGEQLNHPPQFDDQLQPRATYIVSHRAIQDAVTYYGLCEVMTAISQAWWNSSIPVIWQPFYATLIQAFEWAWNERVVLPDSITMEK